MHEVILVTRITGGLSGGLRWRAAQNFVRRYIRSRGLAGAVVVEPGFNLYGFEGPAEALDALTETLSDGLEEPVQPLRRTRGGLRAYGHRGLITAELTTPERNWLRVQAEVDFTDRAVLPSLLAWAALRQVEATAGGESLIARQSSQSFPFPPARTHTAADGLFIRFQ